MTPILKTFADNLRKYRKRKALSQVELSDRLGMNYRHLQGIEGGKVDVKCTTIYGLGNTLNVPPCYLLENSPGHDLKSIGFGCPSSLLDMLHCGVQVNDSAGLVKYANKMHLDMLGRKPNEVINKKHIWDFIHDQKEREELKIYLKYLVDKKPKPTSYFSKNSAASGGYIPVKIDWNYIFGKEEDVVGFLSLITYHPSW